MTDNISRKKSRKEDLKDVSTKKSKVHLRAGLWNREKRGRRGERKRKRECVCA